jgi:hypothetical protein
VSSLQLSETGSTASWEWTERSASTEKNGLLFFRTILSGPVSFPAQLLQLSYGNSHRSNAT